MRLMPTKAVAFRPAGGIKKPIALCGSALLGGDVGHLENSWVLRNRK